MNTLKDESALHLSAVTIGELRRGVELIRHRGDTAQAQLLDARLTAILSDYQDNILPLEAHKAKV